MNRLLLVLTAAVFVTACASQQKVATREPEAPKPQVAITPAQPAAPVEDTSARGAEQDVPQFTGLTLHFEFNQSILTEQSRDDLARLSDTMRKNQKLEINIAGHADERGTTEYNLALGNRRAEAAKKYLATLGVDETRISIVSFGEERPAVEGNSEDAHAANRRDEIAPQ